MIPQKSESSIKNGIWFIHNDGPNAIQVWGSCFSGKEKVYFNNELVSDQRSVKMQSVHKFEDKNGKNYEVEIKTNSLLKGELECIIKKEDGVLKRFNTKYIKGKNFTIKRLLMLVIAAATFGVVSSLYNLSDVYFFLFLLTVLIVQFAIRDYGEIIIEEN